MGRRIVVEAENTVRQEYNSRVSRLDSGPIKRSHTTACGKKIGKEEGEEGNKNMERESQ